MSNAGNFANANSNGSTFGPELDIAGGRTVDVMMSFDSGSLYRVGLLNDGTYVITSMKSGRAIAFDISHLLQIAVTAGIDAQVQP